MKETQTVCDLCGNSGNTEDFMASHTCEPMTPEELEAAVAWCEVHSWEVEVDGYVYYVVDAAGAQELAWRMAREIRRLNLSL